MFKDFQIIFVKAFIIFSQEERKTRGDGNRTVANIYNWEKEYIKVQIKFFVQIKGEEAWEDNCLPNCLLY